METTLIQKINDFFSGQFAWLIIALGLAALFTFNEMQATRLFTDTETEDWKPSSASHGSHRSNIHHK